MEKISESVQHISNLAHLMNVEPTVSPEKSQFLHQGSIIPVSEGDIDDVIITIHAWEICRFYGM